MLAGVAIAEKDEIRKVMKRTHTPKYYSTPSPSPFPSRTKTFKETWEETKQDFRNIKDFFKGLGNWGYENREPIIKSAEKAFEKSVKSMPYIGQPLSSILKGYFGRGTGIGSYDEFWLDEEHKNKKKYI